MAGSWCIFTKECCTDSLIAAYEICNNSFYTCNKAPNVTSELVLFVSGELQRQGLPVDLGDLEAGDCVSHPLRLASRTKI